MTTFNIARFADSSSTIFSAGVANGQLPGVSVVHKFGRNAAVSTSFVPIALGGVYQTPQPANATTLRVKAGDVVDTAAGDGAREITIQGLDATGALVSDVLATAGTSASAVSTNSYIRLFRAWVSASGTYASTSAGSHDSAIVIENGAGGTDWLTIGATGFPKGQSEVAVYSVPLGKTAYITDIKLTVDSGKTVDVVAFKRENILETAAPYTAMRAFRYWTGLKGDTTDNPEIPYGPFPALTDIGFMGIVAVTASGIEVAFEIILIDEDE